MCLSLITWYSRYFWVQLFHFASSKSKGLRLHSNPQQSYWPGWSAFLPGRGIRYDSYVRPTLLEIGDDFTDKVYVTLIARGWWKLHKLVSGFFSEFLQVQIDPWWGRPLFFIIRRVWKGFNAEGLKQLTLDRHEDLAALVDPNERRLA